MNLISSYPPRATETLDGLMSHAAQVFAGLKTFNDGIGSGLGAGASDVVLKVGTTLPIGSVHEDARLFTVRASLGGTETELLRVQRPTTYGRAVLVVDSRNVTNTRGLMLENQGAGASGIGIVNASGGVFSVGYLSGAPFGIDATNRGLYISQNSNSYDSSMLMKFEVLSGAAMASTIPAFDFKAPANMVAGAPLFRLQHNALDKFKIDQGGNLFTGSGVALGSSADLYNVAGGFKYDSVGAEIGIYNVNNSARLSLNIGSGTASCTGPFTVSGFPNARMSSDGSRVDIGNGLIPTRSPYFIGTSTSTAFYASAAGGFGALGTARLWSENLGGTSGDVVTRAGAYIADAGVHAAAKLLSLATGLGGTVVEKAFVSAAGEFESAISGSGVVLKAPNGTRYRLTITNAGAVQVAAA